MIYEINEKELTPQTVVRQSAHEFARALAGTEQYTSFMRAVERLRSDQDAQQAIAAFQEKQKSVQMSSTSGAISTEDQAELKRLHQAFADKPLVIDYFQAQDDLMATCQAAATHLSRETGLNYPSSCTAGCC